MPPDFYLIDKYKLLAIVMTRCTIMSVKIKTDYLDKKIW